MCRIVGAVIKHTTVALYKWYKSFEWQSFIWMNHKSVSFKSILLKAASSSQKSYQCVYYDFRWS